MKSCGGCQYFRKWKDDAIGGGLCELRDGRTKTDHGRKCEDHKRIPYKRKYARTWEEAATEVLENNVELWGSLATLDRGDRPSANTTDVGIGTGV